MTVEEAIKKYGIRCFYHFTDQANIASIRKQGGLMSLEGLSNRRIEPPRPGGNKWSHDADRRRGLDKFVHLAFRENHPMKYIAEKEGRIGPTVILQINPNILTHPDTWVTSDVSNKNGVQRYPALEATSHIDFDVLYTYMDWQNADIMERRRRAERSEIRVPDFIPLEDIRVSWERL